MRPLKSLTAVAAAFDRPNVDTDLIIPKQFLVSTDRGDLGGHLFHDVRYLADGREDPGFFLNQGPNRAARILVARENFGCGSSREHAAWALGDFGFRVILAPSFGDIFKNNAINCGLAPIALPGAEIARLMAAVLESPGLTLTVDLGAKRVTGPDGRAVPFDFDEHRRQMLINGWDHIDLTLRHEKDIADYERSHREPWQAALPGRAPGA
ncbi:MAG: 3-isopropylmalate dehydratase small subunit [Deltaproteobacteria bacterium]|jgi:3-isopropylmalate/(R)-2-methylmalate dehydratase small subunit|nr:3-isopropylmalate dehydratase small subunit [Deltaproteobacteria bacterium]